MKSQSSQRGVLRIGSLILAAMTCSWLPVSAQAQASSETSAKNGIEIHGKGQFAPSKFGKIYYETEGSGSPVFLVAGGPGSSHTSFHPWFSRLAAEHTVVYLDNIGRGRSDRLEPQRSSEYTVERDAEDIEALRIALGYERISVIGHSYGGMPALAYALKYPQHVARLVLSDTLLNAQSWQQNIDSVNFTARNQFPEIWEQLMQLRTRGVKSSADEYEDLYGKTELDIYWRDPDMERKLYQSGDTADASNSNVYLSFIGDDPEWQVGGTMKRYDPRSRMQFLTVPTLVCVGRYDRVGTPKIAGEIKAALPAASSRLVVFERSGHRPWVEETDEYFSLLKDFFPIEDGSKVSKLSVQ
ncbi:proline iminopeptidase [Collimonas sp. OK242]|uniref:alpha/beta fold hydrolase n=1 Tax=Collimonas sp. OK242 TaxID=1798195 RepID=UPI00089C7B69|nr:alpha/beta fold hydrolase [Collimonas sp. OK242]SDX25327.1 proline iminopeptidase [Collimonas sp. OK242]